MSPHCRNCGSHVSSAFARVESLPGEEGVRHCPNCELIRDGNEIREEKSASQARTETLIADGNGDNEKRDWSEVDR